MTLARAKRALRLGQFEDALRLLADPSVRGERRTEQLRSKALAGMERRARRRFKAGNFDAALDDVKQVLANAPEFDGGATLRDDIQQGLTTRKDELEAAGALRREARNRAEVGDLESAERMCREAGDRDGTSPEQAAAERFIDGRKKAQKDDLQGARAAVDKGDLVGLRKHLARLNRQTPVPAKLADLRDRARTLIAADCRQRLARDEGKHREVLDELASEQTTCPDLLKEPKLASRLHRLSEKAAADVKGAVQAGKLEEAIEQFRSVSTLLRENDALRSFAPGITALSLGLEARDRGDLGRSLEHLRVAQSHLPGKGLDAVVRTMAADEKAANSGLDKARGLAAEGKLLAARERLSTVLERWPMHETARRQMDILDQQAHDRDTRLQQARTLAKDARLAEASALLLGLAGEGEEGREARMLLEDINRRMDVASKGLAQVRRAVHGQATSSREGLRHCIARLEEVAKLQADLEELDSLRTAMKAEIRGLDRLDALARCLEEGDAGGAREELASFVALRKELLDEHRLDARFLDLVDKILQHVETELHNSNLTSAGCWLEVVAVAEVADQVLVQRIDALTNGVAAGKGKARLLLDKLQESQRSRSLDDTAELLEEVRGAWSDSPELVKVEARLVGMQRHAIAADEVERLAGQGDVRGAHRVLGEMPPTPDFLRTRIFDIKQGLAKAQGLESGFLLRVDEGGDFLVFREDTITFGNLREGKADVLLLANISGRHARLRRSLSFHGGMEDRILAEQGSVFVNGKQVTSCALKSGDVVRLGSVFEFVYKVPSRRSIAALLQLRGGFQVAGTDKILLMKDRGRDGRILVGRTEDVHVRVPHDDPEVEIFSASDGQIRARFDGAGEISGRPFRGEHPVAAGAWVRCGQVSFVLQPWQRVS